MLEKLSGDAVEPDQLAQLHDIHVGLSQPLRPAQEPGGAEVEWWKLRSMVLGRACGIDFVLKVQFMRIWANSRVSIADSTQGLLGAPCVLIIWWNKVCTNSTNQRRFELVREKTCIYAYRRSIKNSTRFGHDVTPRNRPFPARIRSIRIIVPTAPLYLPNP